MMARWLTLTLTLLLLACSTTTEPSLHETRDAPVCIRQRLVLEYPFGWHAPDTLDVEFCSP